MPNLIDGAAEITIEKKEGTVLNLPTQNKFVDTDIEFTIGVKPATVASGEVNTTVNIQPDSDTDATNIYAAIGTGRAVEPQDGYFIKTMAHATGRSSVTSAGWVDTGNLPLGHVYETTYFPVHGAEAEAVANIQSAGRITPYVNLNEEATTTYGFTTTRPQGTNGQDFLTIDPAASSTAWSVLPMLNVSLAGYIPLQSKNGTSVSDVPGVNAGTNYYVPVTSPSFSGGDLTKNDFSKNDLSCTLASGNNTNMDNIEIGSSHAGYPYYFKVVGSTPAVTGTTRVNRSAVTYSTPAGVVSMANNERIIQSDQIDANVSVNATQTEMFINVSMANFESSKHISVVPDVVTYGHNVQLSDVNNGVYISSSGGGDATATVEPFIARSGYISGADSLEPITVSGHADTTYTTYVSGVTIPSEVGKTNTFDITVPNGNSTQTIHFSVDDSGNVTLT